MKTQIIKFPINNELDIVLAHKRAIQLCELTGIGISGKTRFATSISEICRNCIEFAKNGEIIFSIDETNGHFFIEAIIEDKGSGIKNLEEILKKENINANNRGVGILHARKLVELFNIQTSPDGTRVFLGMKVPPQHPPINNIIIKGWIQHFEKNIPVSPYEEIKKQNMQLLEVTEQLTLKNLEAEKQIGEIRILNNQLKMANKDLEEFAYTISHDLKAPINNIELAVSFINKQEESKDKSTYINAIDSSVKKLKYTIQGLVEIIETQNTGRDIVKEISFHEILKSVQEQYAKEIEHSGTVFKVNFEYETIKYFEAYLHSIMQNLINNSIKYRDANRILKLEATTREKEDFCLLQIKDNGIGMDMNKVGKNIFKPFTRFNKDTEGKGIGLHLVRSMVEKNGGKIEVESEVGKGTTFNIYLKEY
ncbi:MAG TPA: sensor histidine kinase [Cytophagales bacterium]|nr:sensor histidine kinase [Cytophagales bacterium]